jgi:hypothetical protein
MSPLPPPLEEHEIIGIVIGKNTSNLLQNFKEVAPLKGEKTLVKSALNLETSAH